MMGYIAKRLLVTFAVVIATTVITFSLLSIAPGDTAEVIVKKVFVGDPEYRPTDAEKEIVRDMFRLNDPIPIAYFRWLFEAIQGDFGRSYVTGLPVFHEIMLRLPATAILAVTSTSIAVVVSIPLSVISAKKRGNLADHVISAYSSLFIAMPSFWFGLILLIFFSLYLGVFPISGFGSVYHLVLPSLTLALPMSGVLIQLTRASLVETLTMDFIVTARAKGLVEEKVLYRHALRNALIPVVTLVGLQIGYLLSGAVVVETVFSFPGIGKLLADSINTRDIPVIQGCVAVIALLFSITNTVVDITYRILDPRVRV